MSLELVFPSCPKCNRIFKPSIEKNTQESHHTWDKKKKTITKVVEILSPDILVCRYCKISVKVSALRKQKDPIKWLKQFSRVPEDTEISEGENERQMLRDAHEENMRKYQHFPLPEKCPECNSEDLVAGSSDNAGECLSCESWFEWNSYRVIFHGDVEVDAENEEGAIEIAYGLLGDNCQVDIEAEVDRIWRRH